MVMQFEWIAAISFEIKRLINPASGMPSKLDINLAGCTLKLLHALKGITIQGGSIARTWWAKYSLHPARFFDVSRNSVGVQLLTTI